MFNFKYTHQNTGMLNESPQANSIRWKFMYKVDESSFIDQGPWMRCKDYFNDVVAKVQGKLVFEVHGFNNRDVKQNDEGLYVMVSGLNFKTKFIHNLGVINQRLKQDLDCEMEIWDQEKDTMLLLFPTAVMKQTYTVSLLTLLIRVSNYDAQFEKWEDIYNLNSPLCSMERGVGTSTRNFVEKYGFLVPEPYRHYWTYYTSAQHSNNPAWACTHQAYNLHNNGIIAWTATLGNL